MNNKSCRLCMSTNNGTDYLNIFSVIGIEMRISEILSEHFKCEVNKNDLWSMSSLFYIYFISKNRLFNILELIYPGQWAGSIAKLCVPIMLANNRVLPWIVRKSKVSTGEISKYCDKNWRRCEWIVVKYERNAFCRRITAWSSQNWANSR